MDINEKIIRIKRIVLIAGVFTALVSVLMLFNYMQIRGSQPLESRALELLVERLSAEPGNQELMAEIRQLDLLARRAYFSSLWQIRTGGYLLLLGGIVLVIALRTLHNLQFRIQKPEESKSPGRLDRVLAQRWIGISALVLFLLAGASAILSADYVSQFETLAQAGEPEEAAGGIETIRITRDQEVASVSDDTAIEEDAEPVDADDEADAKETEAEPQPVPHVLTRADVEQNHNAFRGAWGNGVSKHRNIPTDWDGESGRNILWKTEIPIHGYNSPVVWGDYLFFSGATNQKRVVYAMDRHSGTILWEREANNIPGSPATPPRTTDDTGLAAPSVTVDGKRVFAIFGTGDIIAFDFEGNRLWARNLGVPNNHYGHSSSLLTWDNKVFVQYDMIDRSRLLALDVASGETVWETPRTSDISWASPLLAEVNGQFQLVLLGHPDFGAYDIQTGQKLWSVDVMSGEVGVSPVYGGGLVFAANEYATMVAVNPTTGEIVWQDRYYLPEVASPVYHDGLLYIATTFAVLASFDAQTGDLVWEFDGEDIYYSSPVIADNKMYVFDTSGRAYIFRPGREPELIGTPELGERVYATPAFANGRIYIRGNKHIFCIGTQ